MRALRTPDRKVTSDPLEMRRLAVCLCGLKECTGNYVFNNMPVLDEGTDLCSDYKYYQRVRQIDLNVFLMC